MIARQSHKEKHLQLSAGWPTRRLGELIRIKHGYAFKGEYFSNSGPFVVLTPGNFYDEGGFKDKGDKEKHYVGEVPKDFILKKGDLLVAMTEQAEGLLGSSAIVPSSDYYLHNQRLGLVTEIDEAKVDRTFLYYLFNTRHVRQRIRATASGTKVRHTSPSRIYEVLVSVPSLAIQRQVAEILSSYDALIENNKRRIKILDEMAQSLYREWFVHFRFPGHEKVKLVNSPLGQIPQGWEIRKLSELVSTQYGYTESATTKAIGPKYVRGMDINKTSYIDWDRVPYCVISDEDKSKFALSIGDVMVIRMADPGKVGLVEKKADAIFASYLIRLKIESPRLSPYFLFYFLTSDQYQSYVTGASTGTTRKSASAGVIVDTGILIPHNDLRQRFEKEVAALRQLLNNLLDRSVSLRRTRDLLLPKLISAEVSVKNEVDSEENA